MTGVRGVVAIGAALGVAAAGAGWLAAGAAAALGAGLGGVVALGAQAWSVALLRPVMGAKTPEFMRRWGLGMVVRAVGAAVVIVLAVVLRGRVPALWPAAGYLVVLLPLLFTETRFLR